MKVYLCINKETKVIIGYSMEHLLSNDIEFEIDDPKSIKLCVDTFENGKIISNQAPEQSKAARIAELKHNLATTDYLCWKHVDGDLTDEEYAEIKAKRHA